MKPLLPLAFDRHDTWFGKDRVMMNVILAMDALRWEPLPWDERGAELSKAFKVAQAFVHIDEAKNYDGPLLSCQVWWNQQRHSYQERVLGLHAEPEGSLTWDNLPIDFRRVARAAWRYAFKMA